MGKYTLFEFNDEFVKKIKDTREIPVHFYNKDGQILIYKKEKASPEEVSRLLKFISQGIFYDEKDSEKLILKPKKKSPGVPEGLTDTKLIGEKYTKELVKDAEELFNELKESSINSIHTKKTGKTLESLFSDFSNQADAMTGLVNIIEHMHDLETDFDVKTAIKRTVVAMALKTRGMHAALGYKDKMTVKRQIANLMMSSLLCDIGCYQMKMPTNSDLTTEQMEYVKNHPLLSYLMIAHEPSIDTRVKHNILTHHRPNYEDIHYNNYPNMEVLQKRLVQISGKYENDLSKRSVVEDIANQLTLFKENQHYLEDANVLAISSEFASLTSETPWRPAFSSVRAVKMIINNSFFSYTGRIMKEFLDYIAISLCDNKMILNLNDYIIIASIMHDGRAAFELCRIDSISRYQSRPGVTRLASIQPVLAKKPKLYLRGFDLDSIRIDRRKAHYELVMDDTRKIVYVIDPAYDTELYNIVRKI